MGLGWLPHSSRVEKASLIHMHSLHLNLNCMSEWVWKVKSWGSSDMSDALAVCCIRIPTPDYFASMFYSGKHLQVWAFISAIAPTPKVSNWHCAKIQVFALRLLLWSSGDWAYWCQSSSSPVFPTKCQPGASSQEVPQIPQLGVFSGNRQSWLHQYQHCYLNWS